MTPTWSPQITTNAQDRALKDTLAAEREMRNRSEATIRALKALLSEVANRYDGARLEEIRRADPSGIASWGPKEWTKFFREIPVQKSTTSGWQTTNPALAEEKKRLLAKITALESELAAAKAEKTEQKPVENEPPVAAEPALEALPEAPKLKTTSTQQVRGKKKAKPKRRDPKVVEKVEKRIKALGKPASAPEHYAPTMAMILADLLEKAQTFPKLPPGRFKAILDGKGRRGGDLALAYQRYWSVIWMIGHWGIVSVMELESIIAMSNKLSTRSGALGRVMGDLVDANLLIESTMRLSKAPSSALKLVQLSTEGRDLFKMLFGSDAVQDELSIMYEKHEGERFPDHTLAVLIFALHARRRGWATRLMPPVKGKAAPDLVIQQGKKRFYVEVERSTKENRAKWEGIASLNKGTVALCAMTEKFQRRLVGDCKLDKSGKIKSGLATNLKDLVSVHYDNIGVETPLWITEW